MPVNDSAVRDYVWGDSAAERARLLRQADRLRLSTQRFLADAGITPGMRVLELGAGPGEVSALIAEAVGRDGTVVSLERSPVMLADAQQRLAAGGIHNVQLIECDLDASLPPLPDNPFDAVVGRLILTHLVDPAATLRRALTHLRPGGVVAFQEADFTLSDHLREIYSERIRLVNRVCTWIDLATQNSSMNRYMGRDLDRTFRIAGLPGPTVHFHTEVYGGLSEERVRDTVTIVRNLIPRLEELGVSSREIDIDSLADRLRAEILAADIVQARSSIASAWTVKPGNSPTA